MQMAIDVGYSHVKAANSDDRLIIPSVVSPYRELPLADLSNNGVGYTVEIRNCSGMANHYFVGELALQEGQAVSFSLDREKHKHPNHDILILSAARKLEIEQGAILAVGLPVAYYRSQKDELKKHLEEMHAEVSLNGDSFKRVSFGRVVVYPQGAGALFTTNDLPQKGLVLLVDIGQKTTDYVTAEVQGGKIKPVSSLCGSIETGVYSVHDSIAREFQNRTGAPLAAVRVPRIIEECGITTYYGKELDLSGALQKACNEVARVIADQVGAALGDRFAFVKKVYLAGGGAEMLPSLEALFPAARILPEPQWANVNGFLKTLSGQS
ncbi:MAG: ParM/StbA family protein [Clostridiales bacterium]|nr:ParM/StbA family protein [Clostridiales bacterium]